MSFFVKTRVIHSRVSVSWGDGAKAHLLPCRVIWQEFRRVSLSGYVLNAEPGGLYFLSLSRHHPQRVQASRRLSKPVAASPAAQPCTPAGRPEGALLEREAAHRGLEADVEVRLEFAWIKVYVQGRLVPLLPLPLTSSSPPPPYLQVEKSTCAVAEAPSDAAAETDSPNSCSADGDQGQASTPQLLPELCSEALSPPKTPSSVSLAESTHSASHSESPTHPGEPRGREDFSTGVCLAQAMPRRYR